MKTQPQLINSLVTRGDNSSSITIIGDSIVKSLHLFNCYTQSIRGGTILDLSNAIDSDIIQLSKFSSILIHVGTNDLNCNTTLSIVNHFETLLLKIRQTNSLARIVISPIIIRPLDHEITFSSILEINKKLEVLAKIHNMSFLSHYKHFSHCKLPRQSFFSTDKLHLNASGRQKLGNCFARTLQTHLVSYS